MGIIHQDYYKLEDDEYNNPTIETAGEEFERCLQTFKTNYIDSLEFPLTVYDKYGFDAVVDLSQKLLAQRKIRFVSVTNFNLEYLQKATEIYKTQLFSHELCYNFEIRENETLGITGYALKNGIINIPYQPASQPHSREKLAAAS